MSISLKVANRDLKGATGKKLRRSGQIPAVFYGRGTKNEHFVIPAKEVARVLATDEHIVELQIDGQRQELGLIQEIQRNVLTGHPIHLSFLKVRRGEKTWMTVDIEIDGEAPGTKDGGDLLVNLREIEIECAPENAPDRIHVDVSALNVGDSIFVKDIKLPPGVSVSEKDLELEVVAVHEHREEAEPQLEAPATEVIGAAEGEEAAAPAAAAPKAGAAAPKAGAKPAAESKEKK